MLILTMIPAMGAVAHAEDGSAPAISIGAGNIKKGNKVYMGIRYIDGNAAPISWIVLGKANSSNLKDGTGAAVSSDNARLLITEKTQGVVHFNPNDQGNTWQGSNIQNWCTKTFLNGSDSNGSQSQSHFTGLEKGTMLSTGKWDGEYNNCGTSSLDNEQLFLLSAEEVSDRYDGYFNGDDSRIAYPHDEDETCKWWLRSPGYYSNCAASVSNSGHVLFNNEMVYRFYGARPAFNFNLTSVLFTSAAAGGKSSGAVGTDALRAISGNTTNEWKLTLKDAGRSSFKAGAATGATLEKDAGYSGWSVPVVYSYAKTGDNEYISVILCDSNDVAKYYGNIANNSAASPEGGQTVNIPTGLSAGSYTMYVFNEQLNGDKLTDCASNFRRIKLTVKADAPETITVTFNAAGGTWQDGTTEKTQRVESGQAAAAPADPTREGYTFDGWDPADFNNVTSDLTVTAKWKKNSDPQPAAQTITASNATKTYGNAAFNLYAKTSGNGTLTYKSGNAKVATVSNAGKVTIKGAGTAKITINAAATANYKAASKTITVTVKKAANPLKIKAKTGAVNYSKLKKKNQTLAVSKVIKFTKKGQGKMSYIFVSAKKGSKSFKECFKINKTTGKATVKKGLKKGTYKVKVKVRALGNSNYKASAVKTVTVTIKVS